MNSWVRNTSCQTFTRKQHLGLKRGKNTKREIASIQGYVSMKPRTSFLSFLILWRETVEWCYCVRHSLGILLLPPEFSKQITTWSHLRNKCCIDQVLEIRSSQIKYSYRSYIYNTEKAGRRKEWGRHVTCSPRNWEGTHCPVRMGPVKQHSSGTCSYMDDFLITTGWCPFLFLPSKRIQIWRGLSELRKLSTNLPISPS